MDMTVVPTAPAVRVQHLDFAYGQGSARNQVLFDVSLEVPPGQLTVLTGPSGSGKTTLLTLIGGLRTLQDGLIEVLGRDLGRLPARELVLARREIGFIFQLHNLFDSLSAAENVRMALELGETAGHDTRHAAHHMLARLGIADHADARPRELSGGQRQRVAIARALANRPRLVLADEPTAALDREATLSVLDLLKQMIAEDGTAVLMVTHDHRIMDMADRIVHMVDGRIASDIELDNALRAQEFLKTVEPFAALPLGEIEGLAETATRRHFEPGEIVIHEGEEGEELYLIAHGEAGVLRHDHEVARLGPAEFFGEGALITGAPRNATVIATEALDTYVVRKEELREAMRRSARFRDQLRRFFARRH